MLIGILPVDDWGYLCMIFRRQPQRWKAPILIVFFGLEILRAMANICPTNTTFIHLEKLPKRWLYFAIFALGLWFGVFEFRISVFGVLGLGGWGCCFAEARQRTGAGI